MGFRAGEAILNRVAREDLRRKEIIEQRPEGRWGNAPCWCLREESSRQRQQQVLRPWSWNVLLDLVDSLFFFLQDSSCFWQSHWKTIFAFSAGHSCSVTILERVKWVTKITASVSNWHTLVNKAHHHINNYRQSLLAYYRIQSIC